MYKTIESERLHIRPVNLGDAAFILELVNTKGWIKFIGDRNISNLQEAETYINQILNKKNFYYNVFERKDLGKAMGIISFIHRQDEDYPDIGFALLPQFEGQGYATEASKTYLHEIIQTKEHPTIIAITKPDNHRAISVLKKLKFQYREDYLKKGEKLLLYQLNSGKDSL